jgi:hypothetical protein
MSVILRVSGRRRHSVGRLLDVQYTSTRKLMFLCQRPACTERQHCGEKSRSYDSPDISNHLSGSRCNHANSRLGSCWSTGCGSSGRRGSSSCGGHCAWYNRGSRRSPSTSSRESRPICGIQETCVDRSGLARSTGVLLARYQWNDTITYKV